MSNCNFFLVLKKEWIERRRMLMIGVIAVWSAYIIISLLLGLLNMGGGAGNFVLNFFIAIIFCMIFNSFSFSSMKDKPGRISTLLLPASPAAKYWARLILMGPCLLLVLIAGQYIGDAVRLIVVKLQHGYWGSFTGFAASRFLFPFPANPLVVLASSYIFYQALFFWGGIIWPRFSFIKTMLVYAGIQSIQFIIMVILVIQKRGYIEECINNNIEPEISSISPIGSWAIYLNFGLALILFVWAYYRFKREDVVYKLF